MNAILTLTMFTPGEVERITGVSNAQQRDWRRRGFLPSQAGHARFDVFAIAELWVLKLMADRGIGPQLAKDIAPLCAVSMVWQILAGGDAYEGDHLRTLEWHSEVYAQIKATHELSERLLSDPSQEALDELAGRHLGWSTQADWLRRRVLQDRQISLAVPAPLFIWWANGEGYWHVSFDQAVKNMSHTDERLAGPVVVLDLAALAWPFAERAGRPFVHVEIEPATTTDNGEQK